MKPKRREKRFRVPIYRHPGKYVRVSLYDRHGDMVAAAKARHGTIAEGNHVAITIYDEAGAPGGVVAEVFYTWRSARSYVVAHESFHVALVCARKLNIDLDKSEETVAMICEQVYRGSMRRIEEAGL